MQKYTVILHSIGKERVLAKSHGFEITLGAKSGDPSYGFNAAETLLAAFGTCLMTNLNSISRQMHLQIEEVEIQVEGIRLEDPPRISRINYTVKVKSSEPEEKLNKLLELCNKYGTVTNTLLFGTETSGNIVKI